MPLLASREVAAQRMATCQACEHAVGGRTKKFFCSLCECVLAGKTKFAGDSCPAGKWQSTTGANA